MYMNVLPKHGICVIFFLDEQKMVFMRELSQNFQRDSSTSAVYTYSLCVYIYVYMYTYIRIYYAG